LIKTSMEQTVQTADPSADLAKGPVFDLLLAPVAPELAVTEQAVEDVRVLTSLQFDRVATTSEINAIGTAFGLPALTGQPASVRQTFWRSTVPDQDYVIERGQTVGTSDGSIAFVVTERVTMRSSQATAYYSAVRRRYEVQVRAECTAIGEAGNLPAFRINRMLTTATGFDGTENREPATGGAESQSLAQYARRIRSRFLGAGAETGAGITTQVHEFAPGFVTDVHLVYPADRREFRRDTGRPAIDVVIVGSQTDQSSTRYVANAGDSFVPLEKVPVLGVDQVLVDGVATTAWTLALDRDPATQLSARAVDGVVMATPLNANQVVDVTYRYDRIVRNLQDQVYDSGGRQFGTDLLARRPIDTPVTIQIDATIVPSFDENRATDSINTIVFNYCEVDTFVDSLLPETLVQRILDGVPGVSSCRIMRFTPTTRGVLPVEAISFLKNELPSVDQGTYLVRVHR
jgi:hypothetical protein